MIRPIILKSWAMFLGWIRLLSKASSSAPDLVAPQESVALEPESPQQSDPVSPSESKVTCIKRRSHNNRPRGASLKTLADILDNCEWAFNNIAMPINKNTSLNRDTLTGLRNLGPHVIDYRFRISGEPRGQFEYDQSVCIKPLKTYSSMFFVAYDHYDGDGELITTDDTGALAQFCYGTKLTKLPLHMERAGGVLYNAGIGFRFASSVEWTDFVVAHDQQTGEIRILRQRLLQDVRLPPPRVDRDRPRTFTRKQWGVPTVMGQGGLGRNEEQRCRYLAMCFAHALMAWSERAERWNVSLRRGGHRVTFCVDTDNTKTFFRDRDKAHVTKAGKRRPIVHHVDEHERALASGKTVLVREHLRGLRKFPWRGHDVNVIAPSFHGMPTYEFNLGTELEEEEIPRGDVILGSKMGLLLSRWEDEPQKFERAKRLGVMEAEKTNITA